MLNEFSRTELLYGTEAINCLKNSRVAVFGVGGVGGYAAEALARSGIGEIDLIDNDFVSVTNINRQIIALHSTVGKSKVSVMKERIADINPSCKVNTFKMFFNEENAGQLEFEKYSYVIDAIDSVKSKLLLAEICFNKGVKIISSMGAGNKLNPTKFEICDISKTSYDPLARVMRKELGKRGIKHLTVVYSKEQSVKIDRESVTNLLSDEDIKKRTLPASNAFVPSAAGLIAASKVINDLCKINDY